MKEQLFSSIDIIYHKGKVFLIFLLLGLWFHPNVRAQNETDILRNHWLIYSDAQNFLYKYLSDQAFVLLAKRNKEIEAINSLSDWKKRQQIIGKTLREIVGAFPEKTPLNAKIVRIVDKESYRIEHIIFESQPGFYVTSSLYIPSGLKKDSKAPAILYCSGHSNEGYRNPVYQQAILNLVKKNFIVFAFDPVGQGERLEYLDPKGAKSIFKGPTIEHSYPGAQLFITGSSMAKYMIWDGIRAVDYLLTRSEVDPERIGITGRSGGGTQSSYIAACDERIKAAAPECYLTNFTRLLQTSGASDAEQNFYKCIFKGYDQPDLLLVRAPKPALMITTSRDIFSIQGVRETEKQVSRLYKAYGKENNFIRTEDDEGHASTKKNREAMYAFFQKFLDNPGNPADEEMQLLSPSDLQVTGTGQVSTSLNSETVFSLNRKETEKLVNDLEISRNDLSKHLPKVLEAAKELSGYHEPIEIHQPVFSGRIPKEGYVIEKYFVRGEGNYVIPYLLMIPDNSCKKAVIYLHPAGKSGRGDPQWSPEIEQLVKNGFIVLTPDLIGTGETGPGTFKGDAFIDSVSHNRWYESMLIGRSIVGIRAGDVVRLARLLKKSYAVNEIYGFAKKDMAPVLLHAASFESTLSRIALLEAYCSYRSIVMNRFYKSSFIYSTVPGALRSYDLPDLASCLAPRRLFVAGTTDGNGEKSQAESIEKDLSIIRHAYEKRNASQQLRVFNEIDKNTFQSLIDWMKD